MLMTKTLVRIAILATASSHLGYGQEPAPTILTIDVENFVEYVDDVADPAKRASVSDITPAARLRNFAAVAGIADIVAVNGQPAKGTASWRGWILGLDPTPNVEFAISDTLRTSLRYYTLEILKTDGTPIGTILGAGPNGPSPAPGAPASITTGNYTVMGGTGAFIGARGQFGQSRTPQTISARQASMAENPASRRINGGGKIRYVLQLIPMSVPQIIATGTGPAVVHSSDFSLVTASKPAVPGEVLSLIATGLGPTVPGVDPGKLFPSNPLVAANSPVEVNVNGKPAEIMAAVGYPGAADGYQVNFRIPSDMVHGVATLQVISAWIAGPTVSIAVQ